MGCFLACFGATNDHNPRHPRRHRHHLSARPVKNQDAQCKFIGKELSPCLKMEELEEPKTLIEDIRVESGGQLSSGTRKKVTFDSNITASKHVSIDEVVVISPHSGEDAENCVVGVAVKPTYSASVCNNGSALLYRYRSYREDEDEDEDLDHAQKDLEVDQAESQVDDDDHVEIYEELDNENSDYGACRGAVCLKTQTIAKVSLQSSGNDENNGFMSDLHTLNIKRSTVGCDQSGSHERSRYISSVLNPVENTAQWKSVKAKDTVVLKLQKENKFSQEERYWSVDPSSFQSCDKSDESKHDQETAVDASLSTWLVSYEKTPKAKTKATGLEAVPLRGSDSLRSEEDKLIIGSLTMEEIKKISASSTPKRSLIRTPDDTHVMESCSVSSFKGIPNTTSKYREDKRVNWHSTPFKTRLDRALNKVSG